MAAPAFACLPAPVEPPTPKRYLSGGKRKREPIPNASPQFAELMRVAVIEPQKLAADPGALKCENCGGLYSGSEARVQRRLKQVTGLSKSTGSAETPRLCWVCSHLHYSAHQLEGLDMLWNAVEEGGLAQ